MLRNLMPVFSEHPLASPSEVRRMIAELPPENSMRCMETLCNWLDTLLTSQGVPPDNLMEVTNLIDEAGQPHLAKLTRYYLQSSRLSKKEEHSLYTLAQSYLNPLVDMYEKLQDEAYRRNRYSESQRALLACRLIQNLGKLLKWEDFRYAPTLGNVWLRLGYCYMLADAANVADKQVMLYPTQHGLTSVNREYLKVLVVQSSSLDGLLPLEIELAEQLTGVFLHLFTMSAQAEPDSAYWVDPARPIPPVRLTQQPEEVTQTLRFFKPGLAHTQLLALRRILEANGRIPEQVKLEGNPSPRSLLRVVRHLASCWAPIPPERGSQRHRVKKRATVLHGLVNIFMAFSGELAKREPTVEKESWVVQNVSQGGFGAIVTQSIGEWIKLGCLIAVQPRGGDNWLLCAVRRYHRYSETGAAVGLETLGRKVVTVDLVPHSTNGNPTRAAVPGLCIQDGNEPGELRLVMPPNTFNLKEVLIMHYGTTRFVLQPIVLSHREPEYEVARYRAKALG